MVIGNLLGRNPGFVTTQGQIIAERLISEGFEVCSVSSRINRALRLAEVILTGFRKAFWADIMILEVYSGPAFVIADVASLQAKCFGIPVIQVLHGGDLPDLVSRRRKWAGRVLNRAARLVAPSEYLAGEMKGHGFGVTVVPNAIDLDDYDFRLRRSVSPRLLWMRSFHEIYNPQMALDTLENVRKTYPEATLVMAGVDKGLEGTIKRSAEKMGLSGAVRFPGFLDVAGKQREFSEADIYLNTNRIDNMPVSVVEACAMGLPVVATDVGGLSKLITHGENGLLVPDGDASAMAGAVICLLNEPDTAERLSRNGRMLAEKSSWKNVRVLWEELFEELLATRRPRVPDRSGGRVEQVEP